MSIRTAQFLFLFGIFIIALTIISGIWFFRDNYYLSKRYWQMEKRFLETKVSHFQSQQGSLLTNITASSVLDQAEDETKAGSVPVLLYHGVMDDPSWQPDGINIRFEDFKAQMFALKKAGYQTIKLEELYGFLRGEKDLPEKSLMITFDDARADSFYVADPVLRTVGFDAVMFVITGRSLDPDNQEYGFHLNQEELKKMMATGRWELGSHSKEGHTSKAIDPFGQTGTYIANRLWKAEENRLETEAEYLERLRYEMLSSKEDLQKAFDMEVISFAFPFGDYGQNSKNIPNASQLVLKESHKYYPLTFQAVDRGEFVGNYPQSGVKNIRRINDCSQMSTDQLLAILEDNQEKELPYEDDFSANQGWVAGWGQLNLDSGLVVSNDRESDSGQAFLLGTSSWKDYSLKAQAQVRKGNAVTALLHYQDGNNYFSCDISNQGLNLTEVIGGKSRIVAQLSKKFNLEKLGTLSIETSIKNAVASCRFNEKDLIVGKISSELDHGGIGFKTWSLFPQPNEAVIRQVNVVSN